MIEYYKKYSSLNKAKIQAYKKKYNSQPDRVIVNSKYHKKYWNDNKDYLKNYSVKYRETHKEERDKYIKDNKEKIAEKVGEIWTCECGRDITWGNKARHMKAKIHRRYFGEVV